MLFASRNHPASTDKTVMKRTRHNFAPLLPQFDPPSSNFNPLPNPVVRTQLSRAGGVQVHNPTKNLDIPRQMTIDTVNLLMDILRDIMLHIENHNANIRHLEIPIIDQIANTLSGARYNMVPALGLLSAPSADH